MGHEAATRAPFIQLYSHPPHTAVQPTQIRTSERLLRPPQGVNTPPKDYTIRTCLVRTACATLSGLGARGMAWSEPPSREAKHLMTKSESREFMERFDVMDTRFDAVDTRLDTMDTRFDAMDARFDTMDARFDAADERAGAFDERLRRVEILGEDARHLLEVVAEGVAGVTRTLEAFRLEVAAGFREQREFVQTLFWELDRRMTRLEEGPAR